MGGSVNFNAAKVGEPQMQNVLSRLKTGPVTRLAEVDHIVDERAPTQRRQLWASLLEANQGFKKDHDVMLTLEWFDPDAKVSGDEQCRFSVVWECSSFQFLQARAGFRDYRGIPPNAVQNRKQYFADVRVPF